MHDAHLLSHIIHNIVDHMLSHRQCPHALDGESWIRSQRSALRHVSKRKDGIFKSTNQTGRIKRILKIPRNVCADVIKLHTRIRLN